MITRSQALPAIDQRCTIFTDDEETIVRAEVLDVGSTYVFFVSGEIHRSVEFVLLERIKRLVVWEECKQVSIP